MRVDTLQHTGFFPFDVRRKTAAFTGRAGAACENVCLTIAGPPCRRGEPGRNSPSVTLYLGPCTARSTDPQAGITWGPAGSAGSRAVPHTCPAPQSMVASCSGHLLFRRILWATDLGRTPPTALLCQRWRGVHGVVSWPAGPPRGEGAEMEAGQGPG